jgi:hypothetical protein
MLFCLLSPLRDVRPKILGQFEGFDWRCSKDVYGLDHMVECNGSVPHLGLILMFGWSGN